jgi:anti-sigma regulatory factor (Ser/Thr protein kinase)
MVCFYEREPDLAQAVLEFFGAARSDEVFLIIATQDHRDSFESVFRASGIDIDAFRADGRYVSVDAEELLSKSHTADGIDSNAFKEATRDLVSDANKQGRTIRAYGEMVALLWEAGNVLAAIELESLWNELISELSLSLLCAYPTATIADSAHGEALQHVCDLHTALVGPGTPWEARLDEVRASFLPDMSSPRAARRLVIDTLASWGKGHVVDEASLVVSELAANAVVHVGLPFAVTIGTGDGVVRIAVGDSNSDDLSAATRPNLTALSGRGLAIVEALAQRWGVYHSPEGKVVWAELSA